MSYNYCIKGYSKSVKNTRGSSKFDSAIRAENEKLRDELVSLRLRISAAVDNEDTKGPRTLNAHSIGLQSKLDKYNEKSEGLKAEIAELQEVILSTLKMDLKQEEEALQESRAHIIAFRESAREHPDRVEDATARMFKPTSFLSGAPQRPDLPKISALACFLKSRPFTVVPVEILDQIKPINILILPNMKGLVWSKDDISRALYITYSYRYTSSAGAVDGQWESDSFADDIGRISYDREVFVRRQDTWFYYGTYQCVGDAPLENWENIEEWKRAVKKAIGAMDILKTHAPRAIRRFANSLHAKDGPLHSLRCLGLERVGFHQELYDLLLSSKQAVISANP
ncbi:uncharacterized protein TRAVEDRAFT_42201 [Trametes versicolor FP-101664 SS1]|uniref:uncharacterized protein n=1 Tax=Trametes versicolor (strain FP-101664) TaxID=717944 RepID=UPI000462439C|nr:uncharacterized protein TRAVEDRAFT_42201 [Trametes versicolor FP-101664 SS1]EIW64785.1 hypothetical protein TRAVEDRAFT_42201 [Trametes versicolor FP-101664 SS1]